MNAHATIADQVAVDCDVSRLLGKLRVTVNGIGSFEAAEAQWEDIASCDHLGLYCVLSGRGDVYVDGEPIEVESGTVFLVPRDRRVSLRAARQSEAELVVSRAELTAGMGQKFGFFDTLDRPIVNHDDIQLVQASMTAVFDEMVAGRIGARPIAEALLGVLLLRILRKAVADTALNDPHRLIMTQPNIARVLNSISSNPGRYYTMEIMAEIAGLTPQQLLRQFDEIFQQTPVDYLKRVRLDLAGSMLSDTRLPVKTIAGNVGFASRSHFSRAFRKHTGVDPSGFRQKVYAVAKQ